MYTLSYNVMIHTFSFFFLWTKLHIASNNRVSPFQHYHEFHPFWNLCSYSKLFSRHTPIVCLHAKSIIHSNQIILSNISDFCFLHFGNNVFNYIQQPYIENNSQACQFIVSPVFKHSKMSTQDFLKDVRHDFYRGKVHTEFVQK